MLAGVVLSQSAAQTADSAPAWTEFLEQYMTSEPGSPETSTYLEQMAEAGATPVQLAGLVLLRGQMILDEAMVADGLERLQETGDAESLNEEMALLQRGLGLPGRFFEGLVQVAKAVEKRKEGDTDGYRDLLLESVWTSPESAGIYLGWEVQSREAERVANLTLDMQDTLRTSDGEPVSLAELIDGEKGLLLYFNASWCGACMAGLRDLQPRLEQVKELGVKFVAVNVESLEDIETVRGRFPDLDITWTADREGADSLIGILNKPGIPLIALVRPDGGIAYLENFWEPKLRQAMEAL